MELFSLEPIVVGRPSAGESDLLGQQEFLRLLSLERKRSERSGRPIALVLLESAAIFGTDGTGSDRERAVSAVLSCTRETDVVGWHRANMALAILFTEICEPSGVPKLLLAKVSDAVQKVLTAEQAHTITISLHVFPESAEDEGTGYSNLAFYPEVMEQNRSNGPKIIAKRVVDVAGSLIALIVSAPIFLLTAVAIKWTSRGPVLFRQTRVGQYGRHFSFLKFRSMRADSDPDVHREYVLRYIAGAKDTLRADRNGNKVYKITKDDRVTPLGRILRATSIDELPQLINVLKGEMSLVGPRPPVPYEAKCYHPWHRRRLLAVKPGITGLWQVNGRSRTSFDDMVRLDLQYIERASLSLDLKILVRTPAAVISGTGAY